MVEISGMRGEGRAEGEEEAFINLRKGILGAWISSTCTLSTLLLNSLTIASPIQLASPVTTTISFPCSIPEEKSKSKLFKNRSARK
jgi:hypothetical protein